MSLEWQSDNIEERDFFFLQSTLVNAGLVSDQHHQQLHRANLKQSVVVQYIIDVIVMMVHDWQMFFPAVCHMQFHVGNRLGLIDEFALMLTAPYQILRQSSVAKATLNTIASSYTVSFLWTHSWAVTSLYCGTYQLILTKFMTLYLHFFFKFLGYYIEFLLH